MRIANVSDPPVLTAEDLERVESESRRLYEAFKRTERMERIDDERRLVRCS